MPGNHHDMSFLCEARKPCYRSPVDACDHAWLHCTCTFAESGEPDARGFHPMSSAIARGIARTTSLAIIGSPPSYRAPRSLTP